MSIKPEISNMLMDEFPEPSFTQAISGRYISSTRLVTMLRTKFGVGAYDVHILRNSYCIMAPRKLSMSEIAECRRR